MPSVHDRRSKGPQPFWTDGSSAPSICPDAVLPESIAVNFESWALPPLHAKLFNLIWLNASPSQKVQMCGKCPPGMLLQAPGQRRRLYLFWLNSIGPASHPLDQIFSESPEPQRFLLD